MRGLDEYMENDYISNKKVRRGCGCGGRTGTTVFLIFLFLKLIGIGAVQYWSWWWVFSPLWIQPALFALAVVGIFTIGAIAELNG